MTAPADTTDDLVEDEAAPAAAPDSEQAEKPKATKKPHTDVPAPLAGPARRTALALGVPGLGLAELLAHANFGWTGVAAVTSAAVVGAGVVYAARRQQREAKAATNDSKVGASKTPSSLASKLRAKPIGGEARSDGSGRRGGLAGRGLAGRMMSRLGGRGGTGGGLGRGGGLGGRMRGVAGRAGARSALGSTGHAGSRKTRGAGAKSAPGARAAAAKAKQLTGGRPSKTSKGLRHLASKAPHRRAGRSGSAAGLGGGSFFGGGKSRSAAGHSRHRGGHDHGRLSATSGRYRPHAHRPRHGRRWQVSASMGLRWRIPLRWPRARTVMTVAGGLALGMLAVPVVAAATAALGVYGACRLASSPRLRYGASVIAGWVRLGVSRAYQWARAQFWKSRGKTAAAAVYVAEGETVDEPYTSPKTRPAPPHVVDAEIVPEPAPTPTPPRELAVAARQPRLSHTPPAPAGPASPQHQEISIVSALDDITASLAAAPAFTPTSGHDAEQYMDSIVTVLDTLGERVSSDLQAIAEHLPQESSSLGTLSSLGEVLSAFATQTGEQVEAWKQTANWVWKQG